jgi:hypothetical protein
MPASGRVIRMEVRKAGRTRFGSRMYQILGNGEELGGPRHKNEVFPFLEWGINSRVISTFTEFVQIHAATMVRGGNGVVFAGGSGSGKSTLAAGLLSRGWTYYCDEFALVDSDSGRVHAFPKALCLKAGSFEVVEHLKLPFARRRDYVKGLKGRVGYVRPRESGLHSQDAPAEIKYVIFPKYVEDQEPRLTRISRAQAAIDLASFALNRHVFDDQALSILTKVARGAQCFRLESGPIDATCELLESLLDGVVSHDRVIDDRRPNGRPRGSAATAGSTNPPTSRRGFLRGAAKLAYAGPFVAMLRPQQALGAGSGIQSCYPAGHACPGTEPCCGGLTCKDGTCQEPCQDPAELCFVDSDCCSGDCRLGACQ